MPAATNSFSPLKELDKDIFVVKTSLECRNMNMHLNTRTNMRPQNINNLKTEKDGIKLLRREIDAFFVPSIQERKFLYNISGIDYKQYSRSIDGVILKVSHIDDIKSPEDFLFVEIKATNSKSVTQLPYGVFFGFTENEEQLFKTLENYRLCFVHIGLEDYVLINYDEYTRLIANKRVQYQISLKNQDR